MTYFKETKIKGGLGNIAEVNTDGHLETMLPGEVLTGHSTTTPLGIGAEFTGTPAYDTLDHSTIVISVYADVASATDGLKIEWSMDGTNWDIDDLYTVPAGKGKTYTFQPAARYLRVRYVNGAVGQTTFRLQVIAKHGNTKPSTHRVADTVSGQDDTTLVKSVIAGGRPGTDDYYPFHATRQGNFPMAINEFGDTPAIDGFARLRVSNPETLFDSKQLTDKQPLLWDEVLGGSATSAHVAADACTRMQTTASASDYAIRQTFQRPNYQPGKGQLIFMTFYAPTATGVKQRIGQFLGDGTNDLVPQNGIWFENNGGTLSFNIAKNGTTTETVTQANWNIDKLDGNNGDANPSGLLLDISAGQIMFFDYEWLGVGRVRAGFIIDGIIIPVHEFIHANNPSFTSVYMSTPNNPLRYDIQGSASAAGQLDHICSTIISEGGQQDKGVLRTINTDGVHLDANAAGTKYALIGARLKTTHLGITVLFSNFTLLSLTADNYLWEVILNPTVAGTFTYTGLTNSAVEAATGATVNTVTGGTIVASGYGSGASNISASLENALKLGAAIDGTRDELVLCVTPLTANADYHGSVNFRELL